MGARYYDPQLGRFTQPDPSGKESNPYAYCAGDPVNHMDPSGLDFLGWDTKEWGNALSVAGTAVGLAGLAVTGGGLPVAIGMAAASTGLSPAGGIMKGDPAGQVAASAIFGTATGGIGVGLKAAGATASTAGNLTRRRTRWAAIWAARESADPGSERTQHVDHTPGNGYRGQGKSLVDHDHRHRGGGRGHLGLLPGSEAEEEQGLIFRTSDFACRGARLDFIFDARDARLTHELMGRQSHLY